MFFRAELFVGHTTIFSADRNIVYSHQIIDNYWMDCSDCTLCNIEPIANLFKMYFIFMSVN